MISVEEMMNCDCDWIDFDEEYLDFDLVESA
jgi:hypothetical protein